MTGIDRRPGCWPGPRRRRRGWSWARCDSPDAWWAASWNQAPALFWEQIPEPELRAARARATALLEPLRAADGSLRRGLGFCYTRATTAAEPAA